MGKQERKSLNTARLHNAVRATVVGLALCLAPAGYGNDFIVDALGCAKGEDGGNTVYCTIQAAIDAAFADGGGDVKVMPGLYRENLVLRPDVQVQGEGEGVIVEFPGGTPPAALVIMENESALQDLTLRVPEGANVPLVLLLISGVEEVEIEDIVLDGGMNRGTTGVYVQNQLLETSRLKDTVLRRLEVGVLAEDTRFQITRCLFEDILRDAIYVRPPSGKAAKGEDEFEAPEIGDEDDLEFSGFNRFRNIGGFADDGGIPINPGDAFLLRNTTGTTLTAQLNDWGLYTSGEIEAGISASEPGTKAALRKGALAATYEPYIGKSIFPGSVFVRLRDAVSSVVLVSANPRLQLGALDTGIDPAFDPVSKLYSFTFINPDQYQLLAQAPAYLPATRAVLVGPGEIVATEVPLDPDPNVEGEGDPSASHSGDQNADGQFNLSEILRIVQLYNTGGYQCAPGTEDGYAPSSGPQDCVPHASDYAPQDWKLSLSEVLRIIQFYNSGGYFPCPGTEDGYCPGLTG